MTIIKSEWLEKETATPVTPAIGTGEVRSREDEFQSALAKYMDTYIADQHKRHTAKFVARRSYFADVRRFIRWMQGGHPFART